MLANYFICLLAIPWKLSYQVWVPMDHQLPASRMIALSYEVFHPFDAGKETIFMMEDVLDRYFLDGINIDYLQRGDFNLVYIQGRNHSKSIIQSVQHQGKVDWKRAFKLFNVDQYAKDLEFIRQALLGDRKVWLLGFSGSATLMHYYLGLFPDQVSGLVSFNPLLFDVQQNLGFQEPTLWKGVQENSVTGDFLFDFVWYGHYSGSGKDTGKTSAVLDMMEFAKWKIFYPGFWEGAKPDLALTVRLFEYSFGMRDIHSLQTNQTTAAFKWMREKSKELWSLYESCPFDMNWINYDRGSGFGGPVLLVGSKYDALLAYQSYEALAEFYANSTLLLVNDAHAMLKLFGSCLQGALVRAFVLEDFGDKVRIYEAIQKNGLLFSGKM